MFHWKFNAFFNFWYRYQVSIQFLKCNSLTARTEEVKVQTLTDQLSLKNVPKRNLEFQYFSPTKGNEVSSLMFVLLLSLLSNLESGLSCDAVAELSVWQ